MASGGSGGGAGCFSLLVVLAVIAVVIEYWYLVLGGLVLVGIAGFCVRVHRKDKEERRRREAWRDLEARLDRIVTESGQYMVDGAKAADAPLWLDAAHPEVRRFTRTLRSVQGAKTRILGVIGDSRRTVASASEVEDFGAAVTELERTFRSTDARLREIGWDEYLREVPSPVARVQSSPSAPPLRSGPPVVSSPLRSPASPLEDSQSPALRAPVPPPCATPPPVPKSSAMPSPVPQSSGLSGRPRLTVPSVPGPVARARRPAARPATVPDVPLLGAACEVEDLSVDHRLRARVLRVIDYVVDSAWPIRRDDLVRIVLSCFDSVSPTQARMDRVRDLVDARGFTVDRFDIVWPVEVDVDGWLGFRTFGEDADLRIHQGSPTEIANAMSSVIGHSEIVTSAELFARVKRVLGITRLGGATNELLRTSLAHGIHTRRLRTVDHHGRITVGRIGGGESGG